MSPNGDRPVCATCGDEGVIRLDHDECPDICHGRHDFCPDCPEVSDDAG